MLISDLLTDKAMPDCRSERRLYLAVDTELKGFS